jgi:hypothetical protein
VAAGEYPRWEALMRVRTYTAMLLLAGLTACASGPAPQSAAVRTTSEVGKKIDDAIAANGPPTLQWDLPDGRRAYQWQQSSVTARVGAPDGGGAVIGAASQTTCYYTLYTLRDAKGLWKVVGYEQPRPGCGRLAMNK